MPAELTIFDPWHNRAGVRKDPRLVVDKDEIATKKFFPDHVVPHLCHPLVVARPPEERRYLAAQHLYQWLRFTERFEVEVVLRTVQGIADGVSGVELTKKMRRDAMKICVDEQFHALYSIDVADQIEELSGIPAVPFDFGPHLRHIDGVAEANPTYAKLVKLLQVIVFETLITSLLQDVPRDDDLIGVVRETVRDHAADEVYHHAYFAHVFKELWAQLDQPDKRAVGTFLPDVIVRSLKPATLSARLALAEVGFTPDQVRAIVAESYAPDPVMAGIRFAARRTIGMFRKCGVFEVAGSREAFVAAGFTDPGVGRVAALDTVDDIRAAIQGNAG
ncbi:para-aminobenzoate N-oxygenase AurF [Amycolatopsis sulphurea]|uniref:Para-aminobenzoate N-oxygenase AurF n=1 Tax=Amycolatopsis sulphurea TaxID=76022 RepID=A0A2A9FCJ1_9PSEU|nr:diiron oxygenase [Amycolatopsis sulphurea]PFG49147.1 para-aminobenzoate N-oxygenase AurF [Amycolatopsis sulphurea]